MKHIKLNLGLTLTSVFAVSVLAVGPVSAQRGADDATQSGTSTGTTTEDHAATSGGTTVLTSGSGGSGSGTSGSGSSGSQHSGTETATETEQASETETENKVEVEHQGTLDVASLRSQANKLLASERSGKKQHSVEDRQKACTARKTELTKKITNYGTQASRHLTSLNSTYDKLKAYQADKKLTVTDFAALTTAADSQKTAAAAAVDALKTVTVEVDCASTDPAASIATVKAAVKNARTALQNYHTAVKNVLVALMTAKNAGAGDDTTKETTQ